MPRSARWLLAVLANQSAIGWRRDQVAAADLTRQAQQIQSVARESHSEAKRLASAIETLNSDRDRLYSRVTVLEQGLDIGDRRHRPANRRSGAAQQVPAWPAGETASGRNRASPPPVVAPVATTAAAAAEKPPQGRRNDHRARGARAGSGHGLIDPTGDHKIRRRRARPRR